MASTTAAPDVAAAAASEIEALLQAAGQNTVNVSAEALLNILAAGQRSAGTAWTSCIEKATVVGTTGADCVSYKFTFDVHINAGAGTSVPAAWETVPLLPGTLAVHEVTLTPPAGAAAHLVVQGGGARHALLARGAGVYHVAVSAQGPYASKNKAQLAVWLPTAARTELTFVVAGRENVQVTAEPSLGGQTRSAAGDTTYTAHVPPTNQLTVKWTEPMVVAAAAAAAVSAVPGDEELLADGDGKGAAAAAAAAAATEAARLSVTVTQEHLFSVGEGMLVVSSRFKYDIRNGALSALEFALDPRLRVLSVDGDFLASWESIGGGPASAAPAVAEGAAAAAADPAAVRLALNQTVEGLYEVFVESEMELGGTTSNFACPAFAHVGAMIAREMGFIAVEARTNVEVDQERVPAGCVSVDLAELSDTLRGTASHPLLLAYKFLQPSYDLALTVQRHGDVSVCVALVETAAFALTLTEQGQVMQRLIMSVRNSAKQYVRVYLASAAHEIWSTSVAGKAVKPATDGDAVMIPLRKDSEGGGGRQDAFIVEMLWVDGARPPMGPRGLADIVLPRVDLPVGKLFVSLWLPSEYRYGEFDGDLEETASFSSSLPAALPAGSSNARLGGALFDAAPRARMASLSRNYADNASINLQCNDDDDGEEECVSSGLRMEKEGLGDMPKMMKKKGGMFPMMAKAMAAPPPPPMASMMMMMPPPPPPPQAQAQAQFGGTRGRAGVVPVRVDMVTSGREFRFERLLLAPEEPPLKLSVPYRRKPDSEIQDRAGINH